MTSRQKFGATLIVLGVGCMGFASVLDGPMFRDAEPSWQSMYDDQGSVIGGSTTLESAPPPVAAPASSTSSAPAEREWNPTPDELYGSE